MGLGYGAEELRRLGLAALLHDVGMFEIPPAIRHKEAALTTMEATQVLRHPEHGYRIILNHLGEEYEWLARVVRQEHERENGSGYPDGLSDNEIDEMAKVIGICDIYDALTCHRPYRLQLLPFKAVKEILNKEKGLFPPHILKAMIHHFSIFPCDTFVRLNTRAVARVIQNHEDAPLRPTIQMVIDPSEKLPDMDRIISLRENYLLHIVGPVDDRELQDLPQNSRFTPAIA